MGKCRQRKVFEEQEKIKIYDFDPEITITTLSPPSPSKRILIIYGGSPREEFARDVILPSYGMKLAKSGFMVHLFDFRSNQKNVNFNDYCLYDRLRDSLTILSHLTNRDSYAELPIALLGISMGGYIAARIAADKLSFINNLVSHLILIAPAAYSDESCRPDVKFGPSFKKLISQPESWRNSLLFNGGNPIKANTLIISYAQDEVVPAEIPRLYWKNVHSAGYPVIINILDEFKHAGIFENEAKVKINLELIRNFLLNSRK